MKTSVQVWVVLVVGVASLLAPQVVSSQTGKLGIVRYTAPKGWTKTSKPNVVAWSKFDRATGKYCILTVYGATSSTGNPRQDFAREWNNLVVKNMKAASNPKTDEQEEDGWTAIAGGAPVESEAGKAIGFLTVISGFGRTISVLAVFNEPSYVKPVGAFIDTIKLDKVSVPKATVAPTPQSGPLLIPLVTRNLTIDDLAGVWNENPGRVVTAYVNGSTGAYVGTDSLHYTSEMTIGKKGAYKNHYFAIRNGKKESDDTVGMISVAGRVISITRRVNAQRTTTTRMVIIGWLGLPDSTLMTVSSNYFPGNVIPQDLLTAPDPHDYSTIWVRKK